MQCFGFVTRCDPYREGQPVAAAVEYANRFGELPLREVAAHQFAVGVLCKIVRLDHPLVKQRGAIPASVGLPKCTRCFNHLHEFRLQAIARNDHPYWRWLRRQERAAIQFQQAFAANCDFSAVEVGGLS